MKKINYVQLDLSAILADRKIQKMTSNEFGCLWKIILHLYWCNGKLEMNEKELADICNCRGNFKKIWSKIEKHFQIKAGIIKHKRVTKELRAARQRLKVASDKGLKGAKARWQGHSTANANAIAKKNKEKVSKEKQRNHIGRMLDELKTEGDL